MNDFKGWGEVADRLCSFADSRPNKLNEGQASSIRALAERLPKNGVIIADEVGMGKTRIAVAVARAVIEAGGRVAILVPPGLGYQWSDELREAGVDAPPILRSLLQYLQAWENEERSAPWFQESAVLVSHSFANWRLGNNTDPWRWALLPEVYALWRKQADGRLPRKYHANEKLGDVKVQRAAMSIVKAIGARPDGHPELQTIKRLVDETPWPGALSGGEYGRNEQLRPWLQAAVGLGLGSFDLIIVDEAHKSRGQGSGLNQLLNNVVLPSAISRCLAMTATPVELDAEQWMQMLERIKVDETSKITATQAISDYEKAVIGVRQCPSDEETRKQFKDSARAFEQALRPYLLRRDKRTDPAVIKFQLASGEGYHAYRHEREIAIDTACLTTQWKLAVCAAEALSFATCQSDDMVSKRLRLTLANGHGIAAFLDQWHQGEENNLGQTEAPTGSSTSVEPDAGTKPLEDKRWQRVKWWQEILIQPFVKYESALFDHPAILAAVEEIEIVCGRDEKVLVFGRFTRPLRALVQLLNAREMLRCLDACRPWPQSKLHDDAVQTTDNEWSAVIAAHRQLKRPGTLERDFIDGLLKQQYEGIEKRRDSFRKSLVAKMEEAFKIRPVDTRVRALFDAFKKETMTASEQGYEEGSGLAIIARAMQELTRTKIEDVTLEEIGQAFIDLMAAASDRDEGDSDGDGQLDEEEASALWSDLKTRLYEEYGRPEGGHARLMYGETKPATRRLLQLAFNRKGVNPKVLVAQSLVGREGLNLHKSCRTVVLLHPEWNPGIIEQQIGRVDRIGSLWEEELIQAIAAERPTNGLPKIEIWPIVFRGTYDEVNWRVLQDRWDDLRAQLHGVVISPRIADNYVDAEKMISEINDAAPDFSPSLKCDQGKIESVRG